MSRKKSKPGQTSTTNNDTHRRRATRERLKGHVLEELWSIWRADPRVPSVKSRRSWAISRDADPRLVDGWFLRRKTCAKKAGQPIREGSYDLLLDTPKREQSATPLEPELETISDLPSDDTLVYLDDDYLNEEASPGTTSVKDTSIEPQDIQVPAYKDVAQRSGPKHRSKSSSTDLYAAEDHLDEDTSSLKNPSLPVCNQGRGTPSVFTCVLCSTKSAQGTPDEILSDSGTTSDFNLKGGSIVSCPRLDFSPDTLSELSAIPFLFRTPSIVPPDNAVNHPGVDNWTTDEELGHLVNDGKLDFSFLDVPHLACMELHD